MDEDIGGRTVGRRIRHYRERAGLSRPVLGGLVGRSAEWVKAVEYDHNGQTYRQEFDLGPYGNAYNYVGCGVERNHEFYPTPTPHP